MEKPVQLQHHNQQPQPQPHEALKCPRCDSSNTKFCYYNNYNLSQPRHLCKACKRYWTRGGTLRNVPVGGGCRKNKRVKRSITTNGHINTNSNPNPKPNLVHNQIPPSSITSNGTNNHLNPLFYGLLTQNPDFRRLDTRVSNVNENLVSGYDLVHSHMNGHGLGFSPSGHAQNSNLTFNSTMYGDGSTSSSTSAPTMASLLASSLNQQQRFMGFDNYDDGSMAKDPKMEETPNYRIFEWNTNNFHGNNKNDQIDPVVSSDPNSLLWDTNGGGGWLDPTNNIGSSVPSLI